LLFVNLHTRDLLDPDLFDAHSALAEHAHRVVLEVTERSKLEQIPDVPGRIRKLRQLGYRVAIDDIGAGYAGLTSFAQLEPDVVKLDMALVRDADRSATKQKLIQSLTTLCRELGMAVVAEGIERPEERDTLYSLGCELMQGYLFAKPATEFEAPRFDV
jgi:EAL domain-containing protein (putative c-di-GMP-specific phosphodiesterase class I)